MGRRATTTRRLPTTPRHLARPKDAPAYANRGLAYGKKGDYDKAIADYTEAIRLNPNAEAYSNRGLAYRKKGDYDKAIADSPRPSGPNPIKRQAYYNRGLAYKKRAKTKRRSRLLGSQETRIPGERLNAN